MERENFNKASQAVQEEYPHDPDIASKLVTGAEFISACEIRVVPKVAPRGHLQMTSAIMQSRVFIPGCRFRIDGLAMVKRSGKNAQGKQWYRVSVIAPSGKILYRGFILQTAIRGAIYQQAA